MFTPLDKLVHFYRINKDNKHPKFVERNGLQEIIDDIEEEIIKLLPHGSGIDCDWKVDHVNDLIFKCVNSYHAMDQNGYYCGWINFTVIFEAPTNTFDVALSKKNIEEIIESYHTEDEEDEESPYNESCPYLSDLDDYIYESISCSLEDYKLRETVKYIKEQRPEYLKI